MFPMHCYICMCTIVYIYVHHHPVVDGSDTPSNVGKTIIHHPQGNFFLIGGMYKPFPVMGGL